MLSLCIFLCWIQTLGIKNLGKTVELAVLTIQKQRKLKIFGQIASIFIQSC